MNMRNNVLVYAAAASTFIAGILHIALVPMFFKSMTPDVMIFFIVSGLAQIFWIIPTIKRWIMPWYYIGIAWHNNLNYIMDYCYTWKWLPDW